MAYSMTAADTLEIERLAARGARAHRRYAEDNTRDDDYVTFLECFREIWHVRNGTVED